MLIKVSALLAMRHAFFGKSLHLVVSLEFEKVL